MLAVLVGWLYPLSLTLRLAAWHSTRINTKLITVSTKHGSSLIITLNIQKLTLLRPPAINGVERKNTREMKTGTHFQTIN